MPDWYRGVMRHLAEETADDRTLERPELPLSVAAPIRDLVMRAYGAHDADDPISLNEVSHQLEEWCTQGVPTYEVGPHQ